MAEMIFDMEQAKSIEAKDLLKTLDSDIKTGLTEKKINSLIADV